MILKRVPIEIIHKARKGRMVFHLEYRTVNVLEYLISNSLVELFRKTSKKYRNTVAASESLVL